MGFYFSDEQSMYRQQDNKPEDVLNTIVQRYTRENPPAPYQLRPYLCSGIQRDKDYRYHADFQELFSDVENGEYLYAWGCYSASTPVDYQFDLTPFCPVSLFLNGNLIYETDVFAERYHTRRNPLTISLKEGMNHLVLRFTKTSSGFGGIFGTWLGKLCYYFMMPGERGFAEGFAFSRPVKEPCRELETLAGLNENTKPEDYIATPWSPELEYRDKSKNKGNLERIFGIIPEGRAIGFTSFQLSGDSSADVTLSGESFGPLSVYLNDQLIIETEKKGEINLLIHAISGKNEIFCVSDREEEWGFLLEVSQEETSIPLENPWLSDITAAFRFPWLYGGPFGKDSSLTSEGFKNTDKLFDSINGKTYWRLDIPDGWLRQYNDNHLYGHWNYPIGVTLYGLVRTAELGTLDSLEQYLSGHIQKSVDTYEYALWDKEQFGGATAVHHLMTSLDSLDDCGSFGSLLLEAAEKGLVKDYHEIVDRIASYIKNEQPRLPDGTFFRKNLMHEFHEETLWADDLYMSVPFLCRYFRLYGNQEYIDDATRQFSGFKKYLFQPEKKIMSHVYDFIRKNPNGVPWGRGNGWTLFSLAELLSFLPEDHPRRSELINFFKELSQGYLALQDESGMWHQVLTDPSSYPETSCTAMFIYGFSKGIGMGLYSDETVYREACEKAWSALMKTSIDKQGNVHGVCRGSEFSFSADYYREKLLWRRNDAHGIGIVLLAGAAIAELREKRD